MFSPEQLHVIGQAVAILEHRRFSKVEELERLGKSDRIRTIHRADSLREEIKELDRRIENAMDVLEGRK